MISTDYQAQAENFLKKFNIEFKIIKCKLQVCPDWDKCSPFQFDKVMIPHSHGFKYRATFSRDNKVFEIDYWSSLNDTYRDSVKSYLNDSHGQAFDKWFEQKLKFLTIKAKKPTAYDILACISGDIGVYEETFEEWASNFGYDADSRKAEQSYNAVCDQSRKMVRFFTSKELEELREIS